MFPQWLRALVSWVAHWLGRGLGRAEILNAAGGRFPERSPADMQRAIDLAQQSMTNAAEANALPGDRPLRDVLHGQEPPDETVEVRALVELTNERGETVYWPLRDVFSWDSTALEVTSRFASSIQGILDRYPGWRGQSFTFQAPMLFGRPRE